jgi:hypothetical protein
MMFRKLAQRCMWCMLIWMLLCSSEFASAQARPDKTYPLRKSAPIDSLTSVLLEELCEARILMMGDAAHQRGFYFRQVTDMLNAWVRCLEGPDIPQGLPRRLFLFLEADTTEQRMLDDYWRSGEIKPYLAYCLDSHLKWSDIQNWLTTDRIEFLHDLRAIMLKIQDLNQRDPSEMVTLRVIGAEASPPYDWTATKDFARFREARFQFFAKQRDSLSAQNVFSLLDGDPGAKGIVYIGQGHLESRTLVNKGDYDDGQRPRTPGYFLPHYLDEHFGRNNVRLVLFFYYNTDLLTEFVQAFTQQDSAPDVYVYTLSRPPLGFSLYVVESRAILDAALEDLHWYVRPGANDDDRLLASSLVKLLVWQLRRTYLYEYPDTRCAIDSLAAKRWRLRNSSQEVKDMFDLIYLLYQRFDVLQDVDSFARTRINQRVADSVQFGFILKMWYHNLPSASNDIRSLSLSPWNLNVLPDSAARQELASRRVEFGEMVLVNLLWLDDPGERAQIVERLQRETGLKMTTSKEWTQWWRETNWPRPRSSFVKFRSR